LEHGATEGRALKQHQALPQRRALQRTYAIQNIHRCSNIERLLPHRFLMGEKVAKPDEGEGTTSKQQSKTAPTTI
jgi:hypothetical protein